MPVDSVARRSVPSTHPLPGHEPEPSRPDRTAPRPGASHTAGSLHVLARHAARARSVAGAAPSPARMQQRLEAYFNQMSGPYQVRGQRVAVPAAFRMQGGMNQESSTTYLARIAKALPQAQYRKLAVSLGYVLSGKGTPAQVRRVTQALIDSPAFEPYAKLPPRSAVRHMMWHYGIGMDCSGYVHSAFLYARGKGDSAAPASRYGLGSPLDSGLQRLPGPFFHKVAPADARPGDVIKLTSVTEPVGHKVIVTGNDALDRKDPEYAAIAKGLGSKPGARIYVISVDSSWGAGGNPDNGGVQHERWAFDDSSGRWGSVYQLGGGRFTRGALHAVRAV